MASFFSCFDFVRNFLCNFILPPEGKARKPLWGRPLLRTSPRPFPILAFFATCISVGVIPTAHADFPAVESWTSLTPGTYSSPAEACAAGRGYWWLFGYVGTYYKFEWTTPDQGADCYESATINGQFATKNVSQTARQLTCPAGFSRLSNGMCTPNSEPSPVQNCGKPPQCGGVGNPINASNGNKYQLESDVSLPGVEGLRFSRHYGYTTGSATILPASTIGGNWRHDYDRTIRLFKDQYGNKNVAALTRADGKQLYFHKDTGGTWRGVTANITGALVGQTDVAGNITGWRYTQPEGSSESYDGSGRLVAIENRSGLAQQLTYDVSGRLYSVSNSFGHSLIFSYGANNLVSTISSPQGPLVTYSYDNSASLVRSRLVRATYPDNSAKLYHYEKASFPNSLTGISYATVNADGSLSNVVRYATYDYDTSGKAILTQHADVGNGGPQERFTLTYNSASQTTVADAVNTQEVMTFTTHLGVKNLVSKRNLSDGKTRYQTFDTSNNLTCIQDEEGRVTTFTYNATNQKASETSGRTGTCASPANTAATRTTAYQYLTPTLDLPTVIESPSVAPGQVKRTTMTYSGQLPVSINQSGFTPSGAPVARSVTLGYNGHGQVISIDGPRTDVEDLTTLSYYDCTAGGGCGQLASVANALGHTTTYDLYDASGRLLQMTAPNGLVTTYQYDPRGRVAVIAQTPPGGGSRTTQYSHDLFGNVATVALPDGRTLAYGYNAANQLAQVTDNLGNRIAYGYDLKGNRTQTYTYDPAGILVRAVDLAYDARNRAIQVNDGGSLTRQLFDALGNLTGVIDPNTNAANGTAATTSQYDALNRLFQTVDLLGGNTRYGYDVNDRVQSTTAPNGATTVYDYDDLGNLLRETSPDRGVTTYLHDAAGNVVSSTDARGVTVRYQYDALNRPTSADYPGSSEDVAYTYDSGTGCNFGFGRLCQVTDASGTTQYAYDAFGNVVTQTRIELDIAYTTSYRYDAANRVTALTYPNGRVVRYGRDGLGRIDTVALSQAGTDMTLVTSTRYRPDGLVTARTFGNGLSNVRTYDTRGRLLEQYLGSADTRLYSYDANGNLTGLQSIPQVGAYRYDRLNRLAQEARTTTATTNSSFTYDANGNRLSENTGTYAYLANSNRLTSTPSGAITLDAAGNTVSDGTRSYTYNNAGQLATASGGVSYAYNHQRQRSRKLVAGTTTVFHYDLFGNLIAETDASGHLQRDVVWADGTPIAEIHLTLRGGRPLPAKLPAGHLPAPATEQQLLYLHTDALDTPRLATDVRGQVVWRGDGAAFGETRPDEDPDGDGTPTTVNLRFPGQYYDQETGLHYNWNRYYDPRSGRYVTSDPIGLGGGLNTYTYALNSPLYWADPTGLDVEVCCRPADILLGVIDHCWIKTATKMAGMGPANNPAPGQQSDLPYGTPVEITDHSKDKAASCQKMNNVDEQCVNDKLKVGNSLGNFSGYNTCQGFAYGVVNSCRTGPQILPQTPRSNLPNQPTPTPQKK